MCVKKIISPDLSIRRLTLSLVDVEDLWSMQMLVLQLTLCVFL